MKIVLSCRKCINFPVLTFACVSPAVQIIPAQVSTPTTIKVMKQSRGPRTPRISGGEERSSPGNRTGSTHKWQIISKLVFEIFVCCNQMPHSPVQCLFHFILNSAFVCCQVTTVRSSCGSSCWSCWQTKMREIASPGWEKRASSNSTSLNLWHRNGANARTSQRWTTRNSAELSGLSSSVYLL